MSANTSIFIAESPVEDDPSNSPFDSNIEENEYILNFGSRFRIRASTWNTWKFFLVSLINLALTSASITVLITTKDETAKLASGLRVFISTMCILSCLRLFTDIYERRYPTVRISQFGISVVRPLNTMAAKASFFLHKNINFICLMTIFSLLLFLDKKNGETAAKVIPALYTMTMVWVNIYFIALVLPAILLFVLIACLPCILIVATRFFGVPVSNIYNRNPNTQPAAPEVLRSIWNFNYKQAQNDESSAKFTNTERPEQEITIQKEDSKCAVCLGWYTDEDELSVLPCSHHFHRDCAGEWFKIASTCPLCVRPLSTSNANSEPRSHSQPQPQQDSNV